MKYKLSRRTFSKLSVLTGAGALVIPACSDDAAPEASAVTLTPDERELLNRFAEVYIPTDGTSLKPLSEVPVAVHIERAFSLMDPPILVQLRIGLKLFN